jgi:hypothetical protein
MRLFAWGHQRPGQSTDVVIEVEGVRLNLTLAGRVKAAKHAQARHADHRDTVAAAVRDKHADGTMDWLESGRV